MLNETWIPYVSTLSQFKISNAFLHVFIGAVSVYYVLAFPLAALSFIHSDVTCMRTHVHTNT